MAQSCWGIRLGLPACTDPEPVPRVDEATKDEKSSWPTSRSTRTRSWSSASGDRVTSSLGLGNTRVRDSTTSPVEAICDASVRRPASTVSLVDGFQVTVPAASPRFSVTVTWAAGRAWGALSTARSLSEPWMLKSPSRAPSKLSLGLWV